MIGRFLAALVGRRRRWEALCRQCGACCYRKEWRGGAWVVNRSDPCGFLDPATRRCAVYEQRFRACPDCKRMTLYHALFTPWLPDDCGYVRAFRRTGASARHRRGTTPGAPRRV